MRNKTHSLHAAALFVAVALIVPACDSNKQREASPMVPSNPPDSPTSAATEAPVAPPTPVSPGATASGSLVRVPRERLCVTLGGLEPHPTGAHAVNSGKMRAVCADVGPPTAELRFTYVGPSADTTALGSGAIRRQLGLKLRAQNGCNLVYAMWRMDPENKLVVSIKSNPGMRTSAECGNRGYTNIKPRKSHPVPDVTPGSSHTLRADLRGEELVVQADGQTVWEGTVGPVAFDGPVGVRSDNGRFVFDLFTYPPTTPTAAPCGSPGAGEGE